MINFSDLPFIRKFCKPTSEEIGVELQKKIDDGTIANLTIENNSIEGKKIKNNEITPNKLCLYNDITSNYTWVNGATGNGKDTNDSTIRKINSAPIEIEKDYIINANVGFKIAVFKYATNELSSYIDRVASNTTTYKIEENGYYRILARYENDADCTELDITDMIKIENKLLIETSNIKELKEYVANEINTNLKANIKYTSLKYRKCNNEDYIFNNVALIGNWTKKQVNSVNCACTMFKGSEILFSVRNTVNITLNFQIVNNESYTAPTIMYRIDNGEWVEKTITAQLSIADNLSLEEHTIRVKFSTYDGNANPYYNKVNVLNFSSVTIDTNGVLFPIYPENKKILFLGDSITAGIGTSVIKGYAYLLSDYLNIQPIMSAFPGGGLVNSSRTVFPKLNEYGFNTFDGDYATINEPDYIFINIGTNDNSAGTPTEQYETAFRSLINRLKRKYPGTIIFCSCFKNYYKTAIDNVAEENEECVVIDTSSLTFTTTDNTHPDELGAESIANFYIIKIAKYL